MTTLSIPLKNVIALSWGTILEWAEFIFYAYMALPFAALFFPELSKNAALYSIFSIFGVSLVARAAGSFLFGFIGDRYGRKHAITLSILLMGFATFAMGLLPTYQQIGPSAAGLLIFLRILQGISLAGEFIGSAIYLVEIKFSRWIYLGSSLVSSLSALGLLLGSLFAYLVNLPGMPSFTWRIPYLFGGICCALALYLRKKMPETNEFLGAQKKGQVTRTPLRLLFHTHRKAVLCVAAFAAFIGFYIYTCNVWWVTYVVSRHYFTESTAQLLNIFTQLLDVFCTLLAAFIAQNIKTEKILKIGLIGAILTSIYLFYVTPDGYFFTTAIGLVGYAIFDACVTSVLFVYFARLLPTAVRYSGQAIGWNFSIAITGSMVAVIAQALSQTNIAIAPALGVVLSAIFALGALSMNRG